MSEKFTFPVMPASITMRHPAISSAPATPLLAYPLVIRRARVEDAGELAELLAHVFVGETWETTGTEHELFRDKTVKATLAVSARERLVATASLQVRRDALDCGLVRWVATDQKYRRKGIAHVLVASVLQLAVDAGCVEARLHTETDRLAAISLYLRLGFEPYVRDDSERQAWNQVARALNRKSIFNLPQELDAGGHK